MTSQREIENADHQAVKTGRLAGNETLKARMTLEINYMGLSHVIEGEIEVG